MSSSPPGGKSPKTTPGQKSPPRSPNSNAQGASAVSGPTLRLSLGGGGNSPKPSNSPKPQGTTNDNSPPQPSSTSPNNPRKRKFSPPAGTPPHLALASFTRVYHQASKLSFIRSDSSWLCHGESTLYVVDTAPPLPSTTQMAIHFRGNCEVDSVEVQTVGACPTEITAKIKQEEGAAAEAGRSSEIIEEKPVSAMETWKSSFNHFDPLEHVLVKPASSYTDSDIEAFMEGKTKHYDADSQCSRGAAGMTTGLRAASIASTMGELRLSIDRPNSVAGKPPVNAPAIPPEEKEARRKWLSQQWKYDLERTAENLGKVGQDLHQQLSERTSQRQSARKSLVAQRLAEASDTEHGRRAFKITVRYHIADLSSLTPIHAGGIHIIPQSNTLPAHIYTTAGVIGDHEGARSWLPCLDSASFKHRASHQITIHVTAPMREGLRVVGCGEDFGVADTWLHFKGDRNSMRRKLLQESIGKDHFTWLDQMHKSDTSRRNTAPHIIPPDHGASVEEHDNHIDSSNQTKAITTIEQILATHVWASASWLPVPARSLGFAIGPFNVLEDSEYFNVPENEDDEDDTMKEANDGTDGARRQRDLERERERIEEARRKGEGIRQVYFAPIYARKYIHVNAITTLLEDVSVTFSPARRDSNATATMRSNVVEIQLLPMTNRQQKLSSGLEQTISFATAGVPHRALSLMRDILALPSYRTSSYTQIWIPRAVNGGSTSGALHLCPEVSGANAFLGGSIMDAGLLPPVGKRLPFYLGGGRVLQMLQARCAIRGWVIAVLPLGGQDDVGHGYIHTLVESFMMSLYERGHGGLGEGGAKGSAFFTKRYATGSGLNSMNLDFLPVRNIEEEIEVAVGGIMGAVPVEDRNNDQLWRSASNGTESCTSSMDEFAVRQLLCKDAVDVLERGTDKDKYVPMPSMGWLGSHLSLSFLSSNATSSSDLGGGALELVHPTGGLVYRSLKSDLLRRIVEGRAGVANFIRLVRAAFIASHLDDMGEKELKMPSVSKKKKKEQQEGDVDAKKKDLEPLIEPLKPKFIICVNELIKKKGLTHTLFTRVLQNLAGRIREAHLLGRLVDVEREAIDPRTKRPSVEPEGFPNSYVRGASSLYLRVGVHVEVAREGGTQAQLGGATGIQLQAYAEPVIPEGGIAYSGPVTLRIVENEGQFREYVKEITPDGSRRDWGTTILHAKPVTTLKAQTTASGSIETTSKDSTKMSGTTNSGKGIFSSSILHGGGYQAIELIRLTNLTPLLWVRVDPMGIYGGRVCVFQQDACLAEQLFHDGDAEAQVDAMRSLAERPLRIQGSVKVTTVYDVRVSELPVRVLGDCLRGSPALHSSLPHTPAVRAQAALAIAQWQNNKAPQNSNVVGSDSWIGLNLLIQYFKERFYSNGMVFPVKFSRIAVKKSEVEAAHEAAAESGTPNPNPKEDYSYQYLDTLSEGMERATALEEAEGIDVEEDEEYRVRSAVITAIASIRAKDGTTPPQILHFMETVLEGEDTEMGGNVVFPDEDVTSERRIRRGMDSKTKEIGFDDTTLSPYPYVSSILVADTLLALCHINAFPAVITDPATGKPVQSNGIHPTSKLMELSLRWLQWELYRESIRAEAEAETMTGVAISCHDTVAACAVFTLSSLAILRQSTTDPVDETAESEDGKEQTEEEVEESQREQRRKDRLDEVTTVKFYADIFDKNPPHSDLTRAACAQAVACIYCAWDRFEKKEGEGHPIGLLSALEFLLDGINDPNTSPSLKHTLSLLMMDACTGKICSMQRVGAIGGRNELVSSAARFYNGPLGASHGGDSGSASLLSVSPTNYPAANAANDGARRGLRLLTRAGYARDNNVFSRGVVVRVAHFATKLWRTINGECVYPQKTTTANGVCSYDGELRCSLLALWQWIWSSRCSAVSQVQNWKMHEGTEYAKLGADFVMKATDEENEAAMAEQNSLEGIDRLVNVELDRQRWRGEMAMKAYEFYNSGSGNKVDVVAAEQGIGQPLPPIQRDLAFKNGGWVASAAQQRRARNLDGGTAVTKLRLTVKSSD